ncbi:Thiol-disulfide isomerase or thioredoxin [Colwellia chukchiensis]|uniref:Thiol-disulfide isomerase or thioredoxin n=1 Tax=Colwellia chukchiensis TaxID=641665 RepID=A0A1H7HPG5_9GAMM|nr:thioredoxin family protein [Colwellia chukchiensis]SEK52159.1 Thiol-disulfide isomerase or thioredoxin [Colwellia chukchiensis]
MKVLWRRVLGAFCLPLAICANSQELHGAIAIGELKQQHLLTKYHAFSQGYQSFQLSKSQRVAVSRWPDNLHIDIYFATWCHDSKREVPKFLKILAENSRLSHRLIALDRNKSEPSGAAKHQQVQFTPTFIVYRENKEIGRIIERPTDSLITDISKML